MEYEVSNDLRIRSVLGRLETIIDRENASLGVDSSFDISQSNANKSRCLYELTLLSRDTDAIEHATPFAEQIRPLRAKLAANAQKVAAHMEAVRAVADLLKNAMQEVDADGTYSQEQFLVRADR